MHAASFDPAEPRVGYKIRERKAGATEGTIEVVTPGRFVYVRRPSGNLSEIAWGNLRRYDIRP